MNSWYSALLFQADNTFDSLGDERRGDFVELDLGRCIGGRQEIARDQIGQIHMPLLERAHDKHERRGSRRGCRHALLMLFVCKGKQTSYCRGSDGWRRETEPAWTERDWAHLR